MRPHTCELCMEQDYIEQIKALGGHTWVCTGPMHSVPHTLVAPSFVYLTEGGNTYHERNDCEWLAKGQGYAARKGLAVHDVMRVPLGIAIKKDRGACRSCYPDW